TVAIVAGGERFRVSGVGYKSEGDIESESSAERPTAESHPVLTACLRAGLLCNEARVSEQEDRFRVEGDPTEAALLVAAQKYGLSREEQEEIEPRQDSVPFESEHQYMATLHCKRGGGRIAYVK